MPAVYIHMSGDDVESKMLAAHGIIEEDKVEIKDNLQPILCPRCKTKNPHDSKYCSTCSMILDAETALNLEQQSAPVDDALTALMSSKIDELVTARINEMLKTVK